MKDRIERNTKRMAFGVVLTAAIAVAFMALGCGTQSVQAGLGGQSGQNIINVQSKQTAPEPKKAIVPSKGISFSYSQTKLVMKEIEGYDSTHDYSLLEDAKNVLHLVYSGYDLKVHHRYLDSGGKWSADEVITDGTAKSYDALIAPDGCLFVAWQQGVDYMQDDITHWSDVIHCKSFKDSKWQIRPDIISLKKGSDINISGFEIEFDTLGNPHCFYGIVLDDVYHPGTGGWYMNGIQLTQTKNGGLKEKAVVKGIGGLSSPIQFFIDSKNIFHIMSYDCDSKLPDSRPTAYIHSFSKDSGKTWEGPFIIYKDPVNPPVVVSGVTDTKSNITMMMYHTPPMDKHLPNLLLCTLKPDSYQVSDIKGYFYEDELFKYRANKNDDFLKYQNISFKSMILDEKGKMHFITDSYYQTKYYITQVKDNAWTIKDLKTPTGSIEIRSVLVRHNGNLFILGKDTQKLYFTQIPE